MELLAKLLALGALVSGILLLISRRYGPGGSGNQSEDVRDSILGGLIWPVLGAALLLVLVSRLLRRLLPAPQTFFDRLPDGQLAHALSVRELASCTTDEEQTAPLILVLGGVGKVRIAAKAGLCPATYLVDGKPTIVREMVYIAEIAHSYESAPSIGLANPGERVDDDLHSPDAGSGCEQGTPKLPVASQF